MTSSFTKGVGKEPSAVLCKESTGLWLCLHFAQLPVEIFSRVQSAAIEPGSKPVVVTVRQRIQYMNPSAKETGIRPGSSMDTAYTLSSQIVSFERDEARESATLSHLAQWAYQFTPGVSIAAPHSLLLEVKGCMKLFGGLANLKSEITEGLSRLGYTANMGINTTPLAALCFARAKAPDNTAGVVDSLQSIPVACLHTDEKIIESLNQMGIKDVGSLLKLPVDGLNRRFGILFTDYMQRITGEKPDPQKFISETPHFTSDITFLADVTNIQSLVFPVKRLVSELCNFLKARQLHTNQLTFKLSHRSHQSKRFKIYLANPENDVDMFLMLVQLQLDKINDMPEVDNLCLVVNIFSPADSISGDLFHGTSFRQKDGQLQNRQFHKKTDQDRANRLLNMLRARLGPQTCFGLSLANDHRPEKAWKTVRLNQKDYWFPENEKEENPRPLYLLNSPQELKVKNHLPCLGGQLELIQGPERIDFGWWDGDDSARDYFISRHQCGSLYWVFNHLNAQKWYLHGIFS